MLAKRAAWAEWSKGNPKGREPAPEVGVQRGGECSGPLPQGASSSAREPALPASAGEERGVR